MFQAIQAESGVEFYRDCGFMGVSSPQHLSYSGWLSGAARLCQAGLAVMSQPLGYMRTPAGMDVLYQPPGSGGGYIDPR